MLRGIWTGVLAGLEVIPVRVEADIASGLPVFSIVGLPDAAVQEARDRVRAAVKNSGFPWPLTRVTVNLTPASRRKGGTGFDVAIALAVLQAQGVVSRPLPHAVVIGELDLQGQLLPVDGILPLILGLPESITEVIVPPAAAAEAALQQQRRVIAAPTLRAVVEHCQGEDVLPAVASVPIEPHQPLVTVDLAEIRGQGLAKRALQIAAAGGHNLLLSGPPGAGKTLLAHSLPGILPPLQEQELLQVVSLHSIAGQRTVRRLLNDWQRPFRSPHHTSSAIALIGGGHEPSPGEVSLAHLGVLFLDELPEFPRRVLESLRQPLEDGCVTISRADGRITFPAECMVVAARNPCPCGYAGSTQKACRCSSLQIEKYNKRVSGPLLDRIDLHVWVAAVPVEDLSGSVVSTPSSAQVRVQTAAARQRQAARQGALRLNARLSPRELKQCVQLTSGANQLLRHSAHQLQLSARAYTRVQKVARTIADLAGHQSVEETHIAEALQFRDRADSA